MKFSLPQHSPPSVTQGCDNDMTTVERDAATLPEAHQRRRGAALEEAILAAAYAELSEVGTERSPSKASPRGPAPGRRASIDAGRHVATSSSTRSARNCPRPPNAAWKWSFPTT